MNISAATEELLEIKGILDKLKIKFWITHGTLLGAVREGNFLPLDRDMDIRILAKDWSQAIPKAFIAKDFKCSVAKRYGGFIAKIKMVKRTKTDLALEYYYAPDDVYVVLAKEPETFLAVIPARFYCEEQFMEFRGISLRVPKDPEKLLIQYYGENWRIPTPPEAFPGWREDRKPISLEKYLQWFRKHPKAI